MSFAGNFVRGLGKLAPRMMGSKKPKANVLSVTTEFDEEGRERTVSKTYDNDITIKPTHRMSDKIEHIRHNMLKEFHADTYANQSGKPYDNPWARTAHVHSENCEHNHTRYNCTMPNCSTHSPEPNYSMNLGGGSYGGGNQRFKGLVMKSGSKKQMMGTGTRIRSGVHDPYDISQSGKGAFDHLSNQYSALKQSKRKGKRKDIPSYGMGF